MNLVEQIIQKRVDTLLAELQQLTLDVIEDGQRKSKSTAVVDLMSARELDPKLAKRLAVIHLQLTLLMNMAGNPSDG